MKDPNSSTHSVESASHSGERVTAEYPEIGTHSNFTSVSFVPDDHTEADIDEINTIVEDINRRVNAQVVGSILNEQSINDLKIADGAGLRQIMKDKPINDKLFNRYVLPDLSETSAEAVYETIVRSIAEYIRPTLEESTRKVREIEDVARSRVSALVEKQKKANGNHMEEDKIDDKINKVNQQATKSTQRIKEKKLVQFPALENLHPSVIVDIISTLDIKTRDDYFGLNETGNFIRDLLLMDTVDPRWKQRSPSSITRCFGIRTACLKTFPGRFYLE